MIAKIVKGSGFREVTSYIIDSKKNARIIAHAGLFIEDVATKLQRLSKHRPE